MQNFHTILFKNRSLSISYIYSFLYYSENMGTGQVCILSANKNPSRSFQDMEHIAVYTLREVKTLHHLAPLLNLVILLRMSLFALNGNRHCSKKLNYESNHVAFTASSKDKKNQQAHRNACIHNILTNLSHVNTKKNV